MLGEEGLHKAMSVSCQDVPQAPQGRSEDESVNVTEILQDDFEGVCLLLNECDCWALLGILDSQKAYCPQAVYINHYNKAILYVPETMQEFLVLSPVVAIMMHLDISGMVSEM
jgi:hypothetical protein